MPTMKVLFVIDTLGAGGAERSLQEMMPWFEQNGMEASLACFHRRSEGVEHLVFGRHPVAVLPAGSRLRQILSLRELIRRTNVDLIHTSLFEADVFGRTASAGLGIPVVTSLVNMAYEPARIENDANVDRGRLLAVRGLEGLTGHFFANHFHAITEAVKQAAVKYFRFPAEKITVVYRGRERQRLGLPSADRRSAMRAALGLTPDAFVLLTAGRQEFQKGQSFLIEALPKVLAHRPDTVLLIAGREGNASESLRRAVERHGLGPHVRFLGHREDVPDLMAGSDVFVLPSLWEGLGCVLIEAMALELPIVASDIEPVREATSRSAAVLAAPGNAAELSSAIRRVEADGALRQCLRTEGRALYESRYTIERSAQGMMRLFDRVIESRRRR